MQQIKTAQLCKWLGVTRQAVWKMVKNGRLPEPIRQRGRNGSAWNFSKEMVYILQKMGIPNPVERFSRQFGKGAKR